MSDQIRAQHYATVVHPFLSVFIPFWFMLSVMMVLVNSAIIQSGAAVFPPFYVVLLLLIGVSETVTGNMLYKERIAGMLPRLREFVFIVIFGFFFILLFHGDVARGEWNPGRLKIWLPMLILAIEWFMCYYVHQKLRERELFLKFFTDKPERETREIYNSYMHEGGESLKAISSVKRFTIVLTVLGFLILNVMSWGFRFNFTGLSRFILVVFFVGNMLIVSMLNTWGEVQFIMMDGLVASRKQQRFRIGLILLIFIVLVLIAIPLTGSRPLLPESYLATFFEWLQNIGNFEAPDVEVEPPELSFATQDFDTGDYLGEASGSLGEQTRSLANLTRIIGWILLVVLSIGAVVFLLLPILRRQKSQGGFAEMIKRIRSSIAKSVSQIRGSISRILEAIQNRRKSRGWERIRDRGRDSGRKTSTEHASSKAGLSRKERRVNNKILRTFFRLIKWGERRGVPFKKSMGAWEYAQKLESVAPDVARTCLSAADMFEEVLYSNHSIEESFRTTFYDHVKQILKAK